MKFLITKHRGFFNRYHKNMPLFESVMKDLNYGKLWLINYFRNGFKSRTMLVYPHYPSRGSTIYKIGKLLHFNITNNPKADAEWGIYWEYLTFREEYQLLEEIAKKICIVNLFSRDISKLYIDSIHKKVFGYSTRVDPLKYKGKIVRKNDINAKHDGEILEAPIQETEQGFIYQLLIDNTYAEDRVMDYRIPVVGEVLDFVYLKFRPITERFRNITLEARTEKLTAIFSQEEISGLNDFCREIRLEYGELDVLRNKNDGRIYIVDVNNTPQGPPSHTIKPDAVFAIRKIATSLEKLIKAKADKGQS